MLPFQSTFYNLNLNIESDRRVRGGYRSHPIFGKQQVIGSLQPANKTNARKLVNHIFIENYSFQSTSKEEKEDIKQDSDWIYIAPLHNSSTSIHTYINKLKTRLPHHLLCVIDITSYLLKHLRSCVLMRLAGRYCPCPDMNNKPTISDLIKAYSSPNQVFLFTRSVLRRVLPKTIWGSEKNSSNFQKLLKKIVTSRRHDKIIAAVSSESFNVNVMKWLKGKDKTKNLETFINWLMRDLVFVLLRKIFYITEDSHHKNRMSFYRKEVWMEIINLHIRNQVESGSWQKMSSVIFQNNICRLELHKSVKGRCVNFFDVRAIPKTKDVRLVMSKRPVTIEKDIIDARKNDITEKTLLILLTSLWKAHPNISGSSGFGIRYIHNKYKNFIRLQRQQNLNVTNYFVKVDVTQCFDTIPHNKLLEVLRNILSQYQYSRIPVSTKHHRISYSTEEVWENLNALLQNCILRLGGQFYVKMKGIPQGLSLACILCNLFYGHLEQQEFPELLSTSPLRVLMRVLDDFLFVTTSITEALDFLSKLHKGYSDYGLVVNPKKTTINFNLPEDINIPNAQYIKVLGLHEPFPWFGHLFLPRSNFLSNSSCIGHGVSQDYSRYNNLGSIRNAMSIQDQQNRKCCTLMTQKYIVAYEKAIIAILNARLTHICYDGRINSYSRILRNIFETSILSSLQWLAHFYHNKRSRAMNVVFCIPSYKNIIMLGIIKTLETRKCITSRLDHFPIMWTALTALKKILSRHHSLFKIVLKNLKQEIGRQVLIMKKRGIWDEKKRVLFRVTSHCPQVLMKLKVNS